MRMAATSLAVMLLFCGTSLGTIDGVTGTSFAFDAMGDHIRTADGGSVMIYGYSLVGSRTQYPGPTLIVNEGDVVTVTLVNNLPADAGNASIVFPGMDVTATGGTAGVLTHESTGPADMVTYTFTAANPGTFMYHSGTNPALQVEMGMIGALIVRPSMGANYAYNSADTAFDHEYLFLLSEMDPRIHTTVEFDGVAALAGTDLLTDYFANYWFINGRTGPDTMITVPAPWLPTQPYHILPLTHPGEKVLVRLIGGGRDMHPYHLHGNHVDIIAQDGKLLSTGPANGADLTYEQFTIPSAPGKTFDGLWEWTGKGMGWDVYGTSSVDPMFAHTCNGVADSDPNAAHDAMDPITHEDCNSHGKEIPVTLPGTQELALGGFYSGSPFLGAMGALPPGEGGLNPWGGFSYMWHSHAEKELTNFDIFPGGMLTMMIVVPHGAVIP